MKYELIKVEIVSSPKDTSNPAEGLFYINVTTGIVGDTYGFTKTDTTTFKWAKVSKLTDINEMAQAAGEQYVIDNYPNK